jgi:preprotein translocase subunit SecF
MYGFIWRHLPGPAILRLLLALVLVAVVVAVLFLWVFPAVAPIMPFNKGTVNT